MYAGQDAVAHADRPAIIMAGVRLCRGFLRAAFAALSAMVMAGCDKLGVAPWFARLRETGESLSQATRGMGVPDSLALCRPGSSRMHVSRSLSVASLVGFVALWLTGLACAEWVKRVDDGIMGTRFVIELWTDDAAAANQAIDAVLAEMRNIDRDMSTYKPDSEVSRVNRDAAKAPMVISPALFGLLSTALEFSRITQGAFDITYASVGFMYDFRARKKPTDDEIESALPGVNYRHVVLDAKNSTVFFAQPGVRIDLGGIAKGYAVDRGIEILLSMGVDHAVVTAGGDSRIIGDRFGIPWIVGIRHPDDKTRVIAKIPLVDIAMSTSGDYERYFDEGGVRYHHIIDPRTGHSASKVRSATILASTATRTDGLSKTAFVLGAEEAMKIYNALDDVDAILVKSDGQVLYSKGLASVQPPPSVPAP